MIIDEYEELVCEHCAKREVLKSNSRTPEWMTVSVRNPPRIDYSSLAVSSLGTHSQKLLCATCFTDWRDGKTKKGA